MTSIDTYATAVQLMGFVFLGVAIVSAISAMRRR